MKIVHAVFGLVMACAAAAAPAGALDDARRHLQAIADNEVDTLAAGYAADATMYWIGGPLDGIYSGSQSLRELWTRFAQMQGRLELAVAQEQENANPKGATVTSNARFRGKVQTKVRHTLVYRDGKIACEIWQIDPAMQFQP